MYIFLLTICFAKTNLLFFSFLFALADKVFLFGFVALKANTILMLILWILLNKVFLFALIFFLISIITLFFLLIDGSLILKYYLIFKAFGCFYCIRAKSFFTFSFFDKKGLLVTKHLRDIKPISQCSKILTDVFFTRKLFKTNIVVPTYTNHSNSDIWYIVTNDDPHRATKNYSYRFGSIECIFKSQKSNGFRLESTNTQKIEHFTSLFTVMCIALVWLTIIGVDYVKNKHHYHLKIRDTRKLNNRKAYRLYSFFNLGLTIFNLCYYNEINFTLKFNFVLYDV